MNGKVGTGNCQSGGEQTTENCNIEGLLKFHGKNIQNEIRMFPESVS